MKASEKLRIAAALEDYHRVFYAFWEMADIVFDERVPTACVRFYPDGQKPQMILGEKFWADLNFREQLFVVCHECLHVVLDHGMRNGRDVEGATPALVNVAQDVTINEMIVDLFDFDRVDFREWKKLCWIDTCFDNPELVKRHEKFTYYLDLLIKQKKDAKGLPQPLDMHGVFEPGKGDGQPSPGKPGQEKQPPQPGQPGGGGDEREETEAEKSARDAVAEKLAEEFTAGELEEMLSAGAGRGRGRGNWEVMIARKRKPKRVKFAMLVKKLKRTRIKINVVESETFSRDNRRYDDVVRVGGATLPGKGEQDRPSRDKLLTMVFMDCSGSCIGYKKTFEEVVQAFDAERNLFETRLFVFDDEVSEIKMGERVYDKGGGTSFDIIEEKVLEVAKEYKKYPDCVVVITDGFGNRVSPKSPNRWIWLLTPNPGYDCIPQHSQRFLISSVTF